MATIEGRGTVEAHITICLSESEAAALDAIVGYGPDEFLKVFYGSLGQAYLKPFEAGLRSLFKSVRSGDANVQTFLKRANKARDVMAGRESHRE